VTEKDKARHRRYNSSEKGRARHARYNASAKGVKRHAEWFEKHYYSDDLQDRLWAMKRALDSRRHKALERIRDRARRAEEERAAA